MANLIELSKKDLLTLATENEIVGRHDMTKAELIEALEDAGVEADGDEDGEVDEITEDGEDEGGLVAEVEQEMKTGKRLTKNTNIPWKRKYYYVNLGVYEEKSELVKKAPNQVQLMLKTLVANEITDEESAVQGKEAADMAKVAGMKTNIESHVLFAYYRAKMEQLGLVFAGYDMDN